MIPVSFTISIQYIKSGFTPYASAAARAFLENITLGKPYIAPSILWQLVLYILLKVAVNNLALYYIPSKIKSF